MSAAMLVAVLPLSGGCALDRASVRGEPGGGDDASITEMDAEVARDAHVERDARETPRDAIVSVDAPIPPDASECAPRPPDDVLHASPAGAIVVDGSLAEWGSARFVPVPRWIGSGSTPDPADLSATFAMAWTEDALFVAIEVRDDQHHNNEMDTNGLWRGDSVQIAFDVAANAMSAGYDTTDDFEYGWGRVGVGVSSHRWTAPIGAAPPVHDASVVRGGGVTIYEIRLSAGDLGLGSLAAGMRMRTSLLVNESDGGSREGFLEWASGVGSTKDPRLFRELVLGARLCDP